MRCISTQIIFGLIFLLLSALFCHSADPDQVRLLWPPPPDKPGMEFLGVFASEADLPRSAQRKRLESFLGEYFENSLTKPTSVTTLDNDSVLITENDMGNILVFDFRAGKIRPLLNGTFSIFEDPVDIEIDAEGDIYVVDQKKGVITVVAADLRPTRQIGADVGFKKLEKVAIDNISQTLYVSDSALNRVFAFDKIGHLLFQIGGSDQPDGQLKSPHGLATDNNGNLFVADTGNSKIKIYDNEGRFLKFLNARDESGTPVIEKPWDIAFDSQGNLHIIDQEKAALITCKRNGEVLFATMASGRTNHLMGFNRPNDLHIDASDRIFVTDLYNKRFCMWQLLTNAYLAENPIEDEDIEKLNQYIKTSQEEHDKQMIKSNAKAEDIGDEATDGSGKKQKKKKRYKNIKCPNCNREYDLVFIGLGSEE